MSAEILLGRPIQAPNRKCMAESGHKVEKCVLTEGRQRIMLLREVVTVSILRKLY